MSEFGITVKARNVWHTEQPGWHVHLPHQCDSWDIAGDECGGVEHPEAVQLLKTLIAEAQAALAALEAQLEHGEADIS